jgi:hypothetical protein
LLGELLAALDRLGRTASTDLLIVSDHGHSSVGGDGDVFPARALDGEPDGHGVLGAAASPGYSASGDVRTVDWLRRAGFRHAYDGVGCVFDPVLGGVDARGRALHATHEDKTCEKQPRFSTPAYKVPKDKPLDSDAVIVATNGGSEYFYVPSHDTKLVQRLVIALQERTPYGALFVRAVYGAIAGTLHEDRLQLGVLRILGRRAKALLAVFGSFNEVVQYGSNVGHDGTPWLRLHGAVSEPPRRSAMTPHARQPSPT